MVKVVCQEARSLAIRIPKKCQWILYLEVLDSQRQMKCHAGCILLNYKPFHAVLIISSLLAFVLVPQVFGTGSVSGVDVRVTAANPQAEVAVAVNPSNTNNLAGGYIETNAQGN